MKRILAPVVALQVPVLGTISDAQESEEMALQELWPHAPHQVCQFHVLREASRPALPGGLRHQEGNAQEPATQSQKSTQVA